MQCDAATSRDGFEFVVQQAVFTTAVEFNNGEAMVADLFDNDFLTGAFDTNPITN